MVDNVGMSIIVTGPRDKPVLLEGAGDTHVSFPAGG